MKSKQAGLLGMAVLLLGSLGYSQESYATWPWFRSFTVNTTSSGAGVNITHRNFPVLVRLSGTGTAAFNFSKATANGSDIRFVKNNSVVRLQHQIERWD